MINLGPVNASTVRAVAQRVSDIICRYCEVAVFVDENGVGTAFGYHDKVYAAQLDGNAGNLVGRYVLMEDAAYKRRTAMIADDLQVRLDEIGRELAHAA